MKAESLQKNVKGSSSGETKIRWKLWSTQKMKGTKKYKYFDKYKRHISQF